MDEELERKSKKILLGQKGKVIVLSLILVIIVLVICLRQFLEEPEPEETIPEPKNPEVIMDIIHGNYNNADPRVYIREYDNESQTYQYQPYIVIDTKNYGDAILLMRENVYPEPMIYDDNEMYGTAGAYYNGSIVDEFLENEFYSVFSDGMKAVIRDTPVTINTEEFIRRPSYTEYFEVINRHVFILSYSECHYMNPKDFSLYDSRYITGDFIPEIEEYPIYITMWTRSKFLGDDLEVMVLNGTTMNIFRNRADGIYVRPVMTVLPDTLIKLSSEPVEGKEVYVFEADE